MHMEKHAEKEYCPDCRRFYDSKVHLEKHWCRAKLKNIPENPDGSYTCPDCGKLFKSRENLEPHYMGHTQNYTCKKCGKAYMRKETLDKHPCVAAEESNKQLYHCDICGISFSTLKYLFRHMTGHTRELTCTKCEKSFSRKQSLLQHLNKCNKQQLDDMEIKIFACSKCPKVFSDSIKLRNHMVWHEGKFRCEHCGKQFSTQMTLTGHICTATLEDSEEEGNEEDADSLKFKCLVCEKGCASEKSLDRHMKIHSDKFQCTMCKKNFGRKLDLELHEVTCYARAQIEEKGYVKCDVCAEDQFFNVNDYFQHFVSHQSPFKCGSCSRPYRSMSALEQHAKTCSGDWSSMKCPVCNKKFRDPRYLQRHKVLHEQPQFHCDRCDKFFHRKDYYGNHTCRRPDGTKVRIKRTKSRMLKEAEPHICHHCGKSYVSIGNLNKHMKRHGEKLCVCAVCGKKFHLKASLKEHMKYVHTKKRDFQCPHCGKMLKSKNTVQAHCRQFHSDNVLIYTCEACGKTFRQKGNLLKHQLMHLDHKTFQCPYCERQFKYPEQLAKHKVEHEQGRRFSCPECEKSFIKDYDLRKHISVFHSGQIFTCEFCSTDCRHAHTIRRHIRRRHPEKAGVLENPNYIKSLQRTVETDSTKATLAPLEVVRPSEESEIQETVMDKSMHSLQPITVRGSEVQIMTDQDPGSQEVAAIIENVMSHEAAEVLHSLANNSSESSVAVATFADIPQFAVEGNATHVIHHDAETQEYILVPLIHTSEK